MKVRYTKWGGVPHWAFEVQPLGEDTHGLWFGARRGTALRRGTELTVMQRHDCVMLVPASGCYTAFWNAPEDRFALYVDVTTQPVVSNGTVAAVDLDLDVIRLRDGGVELLDEDEFEQHQASYGYPPWLVSQARATADWLIRAITAREEPFDDAGLAWLARYQR